MRVLVDTDWLIGALVGQQAELLTRNHRYFERIQGLDLYAPDGGS
jgi:predicted nucleic acid-binding protein